VLRFTVVLPEFKFLFQALVLDSELDHKFVFDDRLLNGPLVSRLPASGEVIIYLFTKEKLFRDKLQTSLGFGRGDY